MHGAVGNLANASARVTAEVTPDLAEILQNSIKVNERGPRENPKLSDGEYSHILIGTAQNEKGDVYIVRSQVSHFANNKSVLESMEIYDVLKGAKAKKTESEVMRTVGIAMPKPNANTTDSFMSVADLLALVKDNYPNILPRDVLNHFGIGAIVQDQGIMFSTDDDTDVEDLHQELRERSDIDTRWELLDTDRAAFRENEDRRRQLRRDIRDQENRPKEITAVQKELDRLRSKEYQHQLLDQGGLEALKENKKYIKQLEQRLDRLRGVELAAKPKQAKTAAEKRTNAPTISVRQLQNDLLGYYSIPDGMKKELGHFVSTVADRIYREGKVTQSDYEALIDRLYESGVVTVPPTEYQKAGRDAVKDGRIFVPERVKAEFGDDWNSFRVRAMAAGVYLVNDSSARGADQGAAGQAVRYGDLTDYERDTLDKYLLFPVDDDPGWREHFKGYPQKKRRCLISVV